MATNKFLTLISGAQQFVAALSQRTGMGDANKIVATRGDGYIDESLLPPGVPITVETREATESIAAGDFVNEFNDGGTTKVRLANASNGRRATGFSLAGYTLGQMVSVYPLGQNNTGVTGLTNGTDYYLSNTVSGKVATGAALAAAIANGHLYQYLGRATGTTEMETGKYTVTEHQAG